MGAAAPQPKASWWPELDGLGQRQDIAMDISHAELTPPAEGDRIRHDDDPSLGTFGLSSAYPQALSVGHQLHGSQLVGAEDASAG